MIIVFCRQFPAGWVPATRTSLLKHRWLRKSVPSYRNKLHFPKAPCARLGYCAVIKSNRNVIIMRIRSILQSKKRHILTMPKLITLPQILRHRCVWIERHSMIRVRLASPNSPSPEMEEHRTDFQSCNWISLITPNDAFLPNPRTLKALPGQPGCPCRMGNRLPLRCDLVA